MPLLFIALFDTPIDIDGIVIIESNSITNYGRRRRLAPKINCNEIILPPPSFWISMDRNTRLES